MKKVIVFQHIEVEDLGFFSKVLKLNDFVIKYVKLYKKQRIPLNLKPYDLMISLGGPMDTWMKEEYPWIIEEKKAIEKFVLNLEKPFLGLCLGCQFLGEVLGGEVKKSKKSEIGFLNINLSNAGILDPVFKVFPKEFEVFQWHSFEITGLKNKDIEILASSDITPVQLFRYKKHAYGIQFHLEIEENTIKKWLSNKSYKTSIAKEFGSNYLEKFEKKGIKSQEKITLLCSKFFENFIKNLSF